MRVFWCGKMTYFGKACLFFYATPDGFRPEMA